MWRFVKWIIGVWLLLVVIGFLSAAFAQSPYGYPYTINGNTIEYTSRGLTFAAEPAATYSNLANGAVQVSSPSTLPLSGGRSLAVVTRSAPSALQVAGAIGRFAGKVSTPLVVGVALYDLFKELGYDSTQDSAGAVSIVKVNYPACTSNCFEYRSGISDMGSYYTTYFKTRELACSGAVGLTSNIINYKTITSSVFNGTSCTWTYISNGNPVTYNSAISSRSIGAYPASIDPKTITDFQNDLASRSSWPSGSAIGRALSDAVKSGETVQLPAPNQITGPASVAGTPTVTTNPDGSKVTSTPTTNITYGPNTVTVSNTTNITNTSSTGVVTQGSSTAAPAETPQTCGYPGGPACKIDETGTPSSVSDTQYNPKVDQLKTNKDAATTTMTGNADKASLFSGWSMFWNAPAVVACAPYQLPNWNGQSMGQLNPCGVVDGVRTVMAYIWAAAGLFMCLGFIRETVQAG